MKTSGETNADWRMWTSSRTSFFRSTSRIDEVRERFARSGFHNWIGMRLSRVEPGEVDVSLDVQPHHLKLALLFFVNLALVWVFIRFDLLTLLCTIFTYSLWWQKEPIGTTGEWMVFVASMRRRMVSMSPVSSSPRRGSR